MPISYAGAVIEFDGSKDFFAGKKDGSRNRSLRPRKNISAYIVAQKSAGTRGQSCAWKSDQWDPNRKWQDRSGALDCKRTNAAGVQAPGLHHIR